MEMSSLQFQRHAPGPKCVQPAGVTCYICFAVYVFDLVLVGVFMAFDASTEALVAGSVSMGQRMEVQQKIGGVAQMFGVLGTLI